MLELATSTSQGHTTNPLLKLWQAAAFSINPFPSIEVLLDTRTCISFISFLFFSWHTWDGRIQIIQPKYRKYFTLKTYCAPLGRDIRWAPWLLYYRQRFWRVVVEREKLLYLGWCIKNKGLFLNKPLLYKSTVNSKNWFTLSHRMLNYLLFNKLQSYNTWNQAL